MRTSRAASSIFRPVRSVSPSAPSIARNPSSEDWDALTNAGLNGGNVLPDTAGRFNVKEAYGEVNVPILKDLPFAKQLNLRAAGRISDYSTVGSVKTWEVGGDWAPIDDVRFRATLAKAVRAPNIGELFTGSRRPSRCFRIHARASPRLPPVRSPPTAVRLLV